MLKDALRYELPPAGQTLLGYIVRRMHKTTWLASAERLLTYGDSAEALGHLAMYAIAASTSFGRAYYQPRFNAEGDVVSEPDPSTGAQITARLESAEPHYHISYFAQTPGGSAFFGNEEITGTTIGIRGLGMPAPSRFRFEAGDYRAEMTGVITSELAFSLFRGTRIRGHGFLNVSDNAGNTGKISVRRDGSVQLQINGRSMQLADEKAGS